jgi:hypothetical protein
MQTTTSNTQTISAQLTSADLSPAGDRIMLSFSTGAVPLHSSLALYRFERWLRQRGTIAGDYWSTDKTRRVADVAAYLTERAQAPKYTPGPWLSWSEGNETLIRHRNATVATVHADEVPFSEFLANGVLIRTAPALLSALSTLVAAAGAVPGKAIGPELRLALEQAKNTITAATASK